MPTIEELLIKEEGFVGHAYKDHLGYLTIGFGRLIDKRRGGGITRAEALSLLVNDVDKVRSEFDIRIPWWRSMNEDRQTVLIAMAFQLGITGLMQFKNTLKAMKAKDYAKAAKGMRASRWARQTPGRAERMAKAMMSGGFP
jgi:lysozyme